MSAREVKAHGDTEIKRLFARYDQLIAQGNAMSDEAGAVELFHAGFKEARKAARLPASGVAGFLAKVDYIISQDAMKDDDANLALKMLRADLAREAKARANKPDPIFAAIAEAKARDKAHSHLYGAMDRAEGKAKKKHGLRPYAFVAWREYASIGGIEIDDARDLFLRVGRLDPQTIEEEYQAAKSRERAAIRAMMAWDRRAGLTVKRQELNRANRAFDRATVRLAKIRPTSPAGAAALLDYVLADMEAGENPWQMPAMANAADALRAMKGGAA